MKLFRRPLMQIVIGLALILSINNCSNTGNRDDGGAEAGVKETPVAEDSNLEKHEHEQDITYAEAGKPQFTVTEVFQGQISNIFKKYVNLKEAFVESKVENVKKEANGTKEALASTDGTMLIGAALNDWNNYKLEMQRALSSIIESNDIEEQRKAFSSLTESLYKTIKAYGHGGTIAYYEFCPMAFNNKGGYWLSDNEKIRNPYFGSKMLTCGEVKEKL